MQQITRNPTCRSHAPTACTPHSTARDEELQQHVGRLGEGGESCRGVDERARHARMNWKRRSGAAIDWR